MLAVGRVCAMSGVRSCMRTAPVRLASMDVAGVPAAHMALPPVRQSANRHHAESYGARRQRHQVKIHMSNSMRRTVCA